MLPIPLVIAAAKLTAFCIKLSGKGAGATWPGEIALKLRPSILREYFEKADAVVLIAGTNGKTTTAKMLETILAKYKRSVVRNASGANLDNGLVSTFISHSTLGGALTKQYFIFEVDEAVLPRILAQGTPKIVLLMNLFRDQLDRYGEVDTIAEKWQRSLLAHPEKEKMTLLINGDDPHLASIGETFSKEAKLNGQKSPTIYYFALERPEFFLPVMQHATDSIFCPQCGNRLTFGGVYFSHLGKYACGRCGFKHPHAYLNAKEITSPLEGVYNLYNTIAAIAASMQFDIPIDDARKALEGFSPAFGRMEKLVYKEKRVQIVLSKNPTGWNESLRMLMSQSTKGPLLLAINDRIPDGRDISWLYDVDFEQLGDEMVKDKIVQERKNLLIHAIDEEKEVERLVLTQKIVVSGDRTYDLAQRLVYAGVSKERLVVCPVISEAVDKGIELTREHQQLCVLPTYSAMLETRQIFLGRKIL